MIRSVALFALLAAVAASCCSAAAPFAKPPPLDLQEPFDVVEAGGAVVLADRRGGAVFRYVTPTGAWRRIARVTDARELEPIDARTVLVTSGRRILQLDLRTGRTRQLARLDDVVLGLDRAPDGTLYASEGGTRIVRVAPGGARSVVSSGHEGVHGLLLDGGRILAGDAFAGTVLAVDLATGTAETLAEGLGNPGYLAPAPRGGNYVSEFTAGRISLLQPDGAVRAVARVAQVGALWRRRDGSLLAVTLDGRLVRVDPARGRVRTLVR